MSNSPLATYRRITKNKNSPRNHKIDTITIHCMAAQNTGRGCADYFATTSRQVSSNYCIGYGGDIAISVDEADRSWCSCSPSNDHRAITIEVATDSTYPYKCTDKAYNALLDLVTDICRRNGIKKLNYTGDTSGNMTKHKWFAATACPGAYLEGKFLDIQREVNRRLEGGNPTDEVKKLYRVQIGAFSSKENAENYAKKARDKGFDTIIKEETVNGKTLYRVQCGAFSKRENAEKFAEDLKKAGFDVIMKEAEQ